VGQAEGLVQQGHSGLSIGADLGGGGPQGIGGLQGVPPNVSNKSRFDVKIKVVGPGVYE